MNTKQFTAQLRREIKTNPKRAFVLAVVCGIGIYFWAPLISGWISPAAPAPTASKKKPPVAGANANAKTAPKNGATADAAPKREPMAWKDISRAIRQDWRMKPATDLAKSRNPFAPKIKPEDVDNPDAENPGKVGAANNAAVAASGAANKPPVDPTPRSLGMKLTSTMIGATRRSAVINGRVVAEGAEYMFDAGRVAAPAAAGATPSSVPANANKTTTKAPPPKTAPTPAKTAVARNTPAQEKRPPQAIKFHLKQVNPQSVVLERNSKQYELKIELPQISANDVIEFTSATATPGEPTRGGS